MSIHQETIIVTIAPAPKLDDLVQQARRYFDRPSFSVPAFIDDTTVAILDDRSGVPQLSLLNTETLEVTRVTSSSERILSMIGSPSGTVVFGMDQGGDERQQVWQIESGNPNPRQLTHRTNAIHEAGVLSHAGDFVLMKSNARDESTFDIVGLDLQSGSEEMWLEGAGTAAPLV